MHALELRGVGDYEKRVCKVYASLCSLLPILGENATTELVEKTQKDPGRSKHMYSELPENLMQRMCVTTRSQKRLLELHLVLGVTPCGAPPINKLV